MFLRVNAIIGVNLVDASGTRFCRAAAADSPKIRLHWRARNPRNEDAAPTIAVAAEASSYVLTKFPDRSNGF